MKSVQDVLDRLDGVKQRGDQWMARCPAHEDDHPSLSVTAGRDGRPLLNCHAGCEFKDIADALGFRLQELMPDREAPTNGKHSFEIETTYDYTDGDGRLLYQAVRLRGKEFRQRRPDGCGGWIWNLHGVARVLYRLPRVRAAVAQSRPVFVVEGERDVHSLEQWNLCATTNSEGAEHWGADHARPLTGANVVILPDNDDAGWRHAQMVAGTLIGRASSVRVLELPGLREKGDVTDWIAAGGTYEEFARLLRQAPLWGGASADGSEDSAEEGDTYGATDLGNAERLRARHGEDLHYCYAWESWLIYDGNRWQRDELGELGRRAKATVRAILDEMDEETPADKRKEIRRHALASESNARIHAMCDRLRDEPNIAIRPEWLDTEPWIFNCLNGTINLRTGELQPHRREDLLTKMAPVPYDRHATCPKFDAFLEQVLPAKELRRFTLRGAGSSLSADLSDEVLYFLHGWGANGKSTLLGVLQSVMGDYALTAAPSLLIEKDRPEVPADVADLRGTRLVVTNEVGDGKRLAEGLVKQLTGRDRIRARFLHSNFFEFAPTFKIWLAANHRPRILGTDFGIWRRIKLIPFEQTFDKPNRKLRDELLEEAPGILALLVRYCLDWQEHGLGEPSQVTEAVCDYRMEMDILGRFLEECCVIQDGISVASSDLYAAYRRWAEDGGEHVYSQHRAGRELKQRGFTSYRDDSGRGATRWDRIGLVDQKRAEKTEHWNG